MKKNASKLSYILADSLERVFGEDMSECISVDDMMEDVFPGSTSADIGLEVNDHNFYLALSEPDDDTYHYFIGAGGCNNVKEANKAFLCYEDSDMWDVLPIENEVEADGDDLNLSECFTASSIEEAVSKLCDVLEYINDPVKGKALYSLLQYFD